MSLEGGTSEAGEQTSDVATASTIEEDDQGTRTLRGILRGEDNGSASTHASTYGVKFTESTLFTSKSQGTWQKVKARKQRKQGRISLSDRLSAAERVAEEANSLYSRNSLK